MADTLGAWVDSAYAKADSLLFTVTPREELEAIGRFQQLKDQAFAVQVRANVAAYNRCTVAEREFAHDEVALAIGAGSGTGGNLLGQAMAIAALPGLQEAVEAGS